VRRVRVAQAPHRVLTVLLDLDYMTVPLDLDYIANPWWHRHYQLYTPRDCAELKFGDYIEHAAAAA
jgi:hypothetical protein